MFTRLAVLLRVKDSNLDLGDQSAASFRLNEPGSPTTSYRPRDSNPQHRGSEPRASSSWARAACEQSRGQESNLHRSASSERFLTTWIPLESDGREPDGRGRRGLHRLPLPGGWLCPEGWWERSSPEPSHRPCCRATTRTRTPFSSLRRRCSTCRTPVARGTARNHELKKERAALPLSYRPVRGPAGTRTQNLPINSRSNPLLHIAVPVRTVGIEPTTPDWKSGMFPLHHVHEAGENKAEQDAARRPSREIEVSRAYASPAAELAGVEPAASRTSTGRSSA